MVCFSLQWCVLNLNGVEGLSGDVMCFKRVSAGQFC